MLRLFGAYNLNLLAFSESSYGELCLGVVETNDNLNVIGWPRCRYEEQLNP
jgi:hypothetical protein